MECSEGLWMLLKWICLNSLVLVWLGEALCKMTKVLDTQLFKLRLAKVVLVSMGQYMV